MTTPDDARHRVRQLILSGDNTLKHRDGPRAAGRARERFEQAREVAVTAGLTDLLPLIDRRLADVAGNAGA